MLSGESQRIIFLPQVRFRYSKKWNNWNQCIYILNRKDYECNRLTSGVLQLSDNTHLVIDETKLDAGRLSATGTKNYNAICDIVNFQNLKYDFQFYQVDYETDIPVLIFSNGASFIKVR